MDIFSSFPPHTSPASPLPAPNLFFLLFHLFRANCLSKPLDVPGSDRNTELFLWFLRTRGASCPGGENRPWGPAGLHSSSSKSMLLQVYKSRRTAWGPVFPSPCVPPGLWNELAVKRLALYGTVQTTKASSLHFIISHCNTENIDSRERLSFCVINWKMLQSIVVQSRD